MKYFKLKQLTSVCAALLGIALHAAPAVAGTITFTNLCQGRNIPLGSSVTCGKMYFSGSGGGGTVYQGVSRTAGTTNSLNMFQLEAPASNACRTGTSYSTTAQACEIGTIVFRPSAPGLQYMTVTLAGIPFSMGVNGSGYYAASWQYSPWTSESGNTCSGSVPQTRTATCKLDGQTLADTMCDAGVKQPLSQTSADYSGCTYQWVSPSTGGACTRGHRHLADGRMVPDSGLR